MADERDCQDPLVNRRALAGLILGGGAALASPSIARASSINAGHVNDLLGDARAELLAARRQLAQGEIVFIGDTIFTGLASRIGLKIGEATQIRLGPEARLKIDKFIANAGGTLTLQSGPMTFERPQGAAPQPMQIRGAFGMIAVRGTHFFAGPSRGKTGVLVVHGSVSVRSGGETVILNAGEGTDILQFGGKPTQPSRWSSERASEALNSVR